MRINIVIAIAHERMKTGQKKFRGFQKNAIAP